MKTFLIILAVIVVGVIAYYAFRGSYKSTPSQTTTASAPVATTQVSIVDYAFTPNNILLNVGQQITFTNNAPMDHTVVADDNSFDSGIIAPGTTFKKTFDTPGTYTFHCRIHPSMTGKITVQ